MIVEFFAFEEVLNSSFRLRFFWARPFGPGRPLYLLLSGPRFNDKLSGKQKDAAATPRAVERRERGFCSLQKLLSISITSY